MTKNVKFLFVFSSSDKTDVESTHSSNLSAHRDNKMHAIIPPDALYGTVEKKLPSNRFAYIDTADFNDSKVSFIFSCISIIIIGHEYLRVSIRHTFKSMTILLNNFFTSNRRKFFY